MIRINLQDPDECAKIVAQHRRERRLAYGAAWRAAYPTAFVDYYAAHKDERHAYCQQWRAENVAHVKAYMDAWHAAHTEHSAAYAKSYWALHAERKIALARAYMPGYYRANKAAFIARNEIRRARINNAPKIDLTPRQWRMIQAAYHYRCAYCHRKPRRLTKDHVVPISKGGGHTASNIVPACRSCNAKKHRNPPPCATQIVLPLL